MRTFVLVALLACGACAQLGIRRKPDPATTADSLYWSAVANLDPANRSGTLDAALTSLEAYLASPGRLRHQREANALRSLARSAQQLARVEAALQQARASLATAQAPAPADAKPRDAEPRAAGRDEEMVKEVQRLKEELAKANEELDRIKKRLAAPKP